MDVCCVRGCTSINKDKDIFYFEFPLSRTLRRKWLDVIKIGSKVPLGTLICSQHFDINDYETVRGKVRLKKKVVPTVVNNDTIENKSPKNIDKDSETTEDSVEKEVRENPKDDALDTPLNKEEDCDKSPNLKELIKERDSEKEIKKSTEIDSLTEIDCVIDRVSQKKENEDDSMSKRDPDRRDLITNRERETDGAVSEDNSKDTPISKDRAPPAPDPKQPADFEEMITNYHIKINKPDVLRSDEMEIEVPNECERDSTIVVDDIGDTPPVYIEIPIDIDPNPKNINNQDCLMVLESVQVDVDPTSLMLPEIETAELNQESDSDVEINVPEEKTDPISLLTSSDEDDVIIQEPKIDTVDVSDETDEDDMPLVKLVKKKPLKKRPIRQSSKLGPVNGQELRNIIWSGDYFYCVHCNFSTTDRVEYVNHLEEHDRALHICTVCSYTTASKKQYSRHLRKHKEEKKYNCHLCDYQAKHNMSLIYHLQSHKSSDIESVKKGYKCVKRGYKCVKCGYRSDYKGDVVKHLKMCNSDKKHKCNLCPYTTKRKSDLKRHWTSRHSDVVEVESDDTYKPPGWD